MSAASLDHVVAIGGSAGAFGTMLAQARRARAGGHACLFLVYHRAGEQDFRFLPFMPADGLRSAPAATGTPVAVDNLYYPYRSQDLVVRDGRLLVQTPQRRHHPNIDRLFTSLAENYGRRVLAVLLSGYGDDGVEGLRQVRARGGRTIVQDPRDAPFPDLPSLAVAAGVADEVLPTARILDVVTERLRGRTVPWPEERRSRARPAGAAAPGGQG